MRLPPWAAGLTLGVNFLDIRFWLLHSSPWFFPTDFHSTWFVKCSARLIVKCLTCPSFRVDLLCELTSSCSHKPGNDVTPKKHLDRKDGIRKMKYEQILIVLVLCKPIFLLIGRLKKETVSTCDVWQNPGQIVSEILDFHHWNSEVRSLHWNTYEYRPFPSTCHIPFSNLLFHTQIWNST